MGSALVLGLLALMICCVLLGYPVAIVLGGVSLIVGYVALGPAFMQFLPSRYMGVLSNYVLLAVPMFIVMGLALQRSGLTQVLLAAFAKTLRSVPGGMALAVLFVGALLAASTGIVGASVVTLGLIALPVLKRAGYRDDIAAGIVASAGSLGQIVPPSIVLILLASVMQVSAGALFAAAVWPSLLIVGGYVAFIVSAALCSRSALCPGRNLRIALDGPPMWLAIGGPLLLIAGVLGTILAGIASPTEASGVGAALAVALFLISRRYTDADSRVQVVVAAEQPAATRSKLAISSSHDLLDIAAEALRLTSMVFLILFGATTFALVFRGLGGDDLMIDYVQSSGLGAEGFVVLVLVIVFVAGFFVDFIEIIFIVVPVVLPLLQAYGIDPLWFAVLLGVNLQTSFLTPPFGFSLFYLRGVAPAAMSTESIYRGVLPYVAIQLGVLAYLFFSHV